MNKSINTIFNELWNKYPAVHRINFEFENKSISLYSNSKEILDKVGYYLCDFVCEGKRTDLLLAIIDLDSGNKVLSGDNGEAEKVVNSFEDGYMEYERNSKMSYLYSKNRCMLVGPIPQNIFRVNDFICSIGNERLKA